jgi:hypothetical protein
MVNAKVHGSSLQPQSMVRVSNHRAPLVRVVQVLVAQRPSSRWCHTAQSPEALVIATAPAHQTTVIVPVAHQWPESDHTSEAFTLVDKERK